MMMKQCDEGMKERNDIKDCFGRKWHEGKKASVLPLTTRKAELIVSSEQHE